jgi:hypothetical protein
MKKLIIAAALFISAGICISASLLPGSSKEVKAVPIAPVEPNTSMVMKDLGTAD